jgi:hypothetical protein
MKNIFLIFVLFCFTQDLYSQTTIFFQSFENRGLNCTENWGYLGGNRNSENVKSGTFSNRIGRLGESNTIQLNTVDVSGMSNLYLKIHHSVIADNGAGLDDYEGAEFLVSLNGGLFTPVGGVSGGADYGYSYSATTAGIQSSNNICNPFTVNNPLNYAIPAGTNTIAVLIISVSGSSCRNFSNRMNSGTAVNYNGANEGFYVDDISIVSNDPNIRSIWKGTANTNWFDCRNWHNNIVPTIQSSVIIDETAINNCVIGINSGTSAFCKELTVSSINAVSNNLTIQNGSSLTVNQSVLVNKTAGATPITIEMLGGSTLNCSSLTLTGTSNGDENAVLKIEDLMSRVNVAGDFVNNPGGSLDMSNGGLASGVIALGGNWYSNGLESDFKESGSTVIFTDGNIQTINSNNFTEVFHNISLDKSNAEITLMTDIELDGTGVLDLVDDYLILNGYKLTLQSPSSMAISNSGSGAIISETTDNMSRVSWNIGSNSEIHVFPFARSINSDYIPFFFEVTSGNAGVVTLSTYNTGVDNLPWPNSPISTVNNLGYPENSDATADRFWHIDVTGNPVATITFTYASVELPISPFDDPFELVAQRYESSNDQWQQPLPGQNATNNSVSVSGVTNFSTWALSNQNSILPVELVQFKSEIVGQAVNLNWSTASENNTKVFVVEKSENAKDFESISEVAAVGFSTILNDYNFTDYKAQNGFNYYRLKIVDFDNTSTYSNIIVQDFKKASFVNVYPNPLIAERKINIDAPFSIEKLSILNAQGHQIVQFEKPENSINLPSDLSVGIYYLVFESNGENIVNKIIIQE